MRILHTMLRVKDLDASIAFYENALGMKLLRKKDYPSGKFTLAFVGYQPESEAAVIELTYNWDDREYTLGDAFGHIAIEVDDIKSVCEKVKSLGYRVTREPGPMKHGTRELAFIQDPDGYSIELLASGF